MGFSSAKWQFEERIASFMDIENLEIVRVINVDEKNSLLFCFPDHFSLCGYSFSRVDNDIFTVYGKRLPSKIRKDKNFVLGKESRPYTLLDDILIIASLLSGRNWFREALNGPESSLRLLSDVNCFRSQSLLFPASVSNNKHFFDFIEKCVLEMSDESWLNRYENGFHLKMLFNNSAYIFKPESRFLSMMVIWEWLYTHIKGRESFDLPKIIQEVLVDSFGKHSAPKMNIFHVLRNQLAHSGKLPIDRPYAEDWMKSLLFNDDVKGPSIMRYMDFFNELTRVLAFKAFDIHLEEQPRMNISDNLKEFLSTGKIK